ncbi:hypothetical protein ACSFC1_04305 [Pseudothermotoga sp. U03pept]
MQKTLRILIGSCGGLTGVYLSKLIRKLNIPGFERVEIFWV